MLRLEFASRFRRRGGNPESSSATAAKRARHGCKACSIAASCRRPFPSRSLPRAASVARPRRLPKTRASNNRVLPRRLEEIGKGQSRPVGLRSSAPGCQVQEPSSVTAEHDRAEDIRKIAGYGSRGLGTTRSPVLIKFLSAVNVGSDERSRRVRSDGAAPINSRNSRLMCA
jgi:hypothetical protein